MATMNPFYRFEDSIEVSSMGQGAKTISFATYLIYQDITSTLYLGNTIEYMVNSINQILLTYNSTYQSNFICEFVPFPTPAAYPENAQVYVYDTNIVKVFPLLRISIVCERNSAKNIIGYKPSFVGYLNDTFSYSPALFHGEMDAYNALVDYTNTGSLIFPKAYKFDPATGIATSSVARFKDCKFSSSLGVAVRVNADIDPRGNRPVIKQSALDADGKYIVALFDLMIASSQKVGATWSSLIAEPDAWVLPNGFFMSKIIDTGGDNRIQVDVFKSGGVGFSLIMREDDGFLFQRFFAPNYSPYDILDDYASSVLLPYETTSNDKKYGNIFYDFEFCEFPICTYPPKESYLMPIKTGDEFKFNVHPYLGNVMTKPSVDVGLFDSNFNLVQKVGNSVMRTKLAWRMTEFYTYPNLPLAQKLVPQTLFITTPGGSDVLSAEYIYFADLPGNNLQIQTIDILNAWNANVSIGTICFQSIDDPIYAYEVTWELPEAFSTGYEIGATGWTDVSPYPFVNTIYQTTSVSIYQFQSDALIPSVAPGCYRFGLYQLEYGYDGLKTTWQPQTISAGTNYVFALCGSTGVAEFTWAIPNSIGSWSELCEWIKDNMLFGDVTINPSTDELTISICPYVALLNWTIQLGTYDYNVGTLSPFTPYQIDSVDCGDSPVNEIYAFSNILNLDNSDCFSSIIQYWAESNAIAEGNEYYGDWYQQIRLGINGAGQKPVISESVYRQSNGVHRRPSNKQDLSIDLHTDFLDFETQCALVDATRHPNFVFNGQSLFVNGDIDVATIQDFSTQTSFEDLAQVRFSALIQGYQPKNSTCLNC
jgi:hypothetical protein